LFFYKITNHICGKYHKQSIIIIKIILKAIYYYLKLRIKFFGPKKSVLFAGQAYYNAWYLSRELRELNWKADVLNWDANPGSQIYYHGEDFKYKMDSKFHIYEALWFYIKALLKYDVFHFSNMNGITFGFIISNWFSSNFGANFEIYFLKKIGKRIVYSNNGCMDGVSQTSFSKWGPESVCSICNWQNFPSVCNDTKNLTWGQFRNKIADYQCLFGGNRADYNISSTVHEVPEFYCLNEKFWHPDLEIPQEFKLSKQKTDTIFLYHAVGNKKDRTNQKGINIKSSHIYLPLIEKLKQEGMDLELICPENVPNKDVRYYQLQSDIVLEMLTYGWYGANAREAMMLGKPVICFLRPEWLDSLRKELPECAYELPIVNATPETVESILKDLINNPDKRFEIGKLSRNFSLKWHSATVAAKKFDEIYLKLLYSTHKSEKFV